MPRYQIRLNLQEKGRYCEVVARSKGEALAKARLGEYDPDVGLTDPEAIYVSTSGLCVEIPAREGDDEQGS